MNKIKSTDLKLGMCFSSPVFFDDGINMFISHTIPHFKKFIFASIIGLFVFFIQFFKINRYFYRDRSYKYTRGGADNGNKHTS